MSVIRIKPRTFQAVCECGACGPCASTKELAHDRYKEVYDTLETTVVHWEKTVLKAA